MSGSKRVTIKDLLEEIKHLKAKVDEVDDLKRRITILEKDLSNLKIKNKKDFEIKPMDEKVHCTKCHKKFCNQDDLMRHEKSKHDRELNIKCKSCDKVFSKNCDLELHLEKEHKIPKTFKCDRCDMDFMLKWRLDKHISLHQENLGAVRFCHYYNNSKDCPFFELGCMFKHEDAPQCKFSDSCSKNLCQYKHTKGNENVEMIDDEGFNLYVEHNFEKVYDQYMKENQHIKCYYCTYTSKSTLLMKIQMEVHEHLKITHKEVITKPTTDPDSFDFVDFWSFLGLLAI